MAIEDIENEIRDIINWVKVLQLEQEEGETARIEENAANLLLQKLENLTNKVRELI